MNREFTRDEAIMFLRGSMLGDMCIEKLGSIINTQSIIHEDYVKLKYDIFSKHFNCGKIGNSNNWGTNPDPKLRIAKRFRIYDKNLSKEFKEIMYQSEKRFIPDIKFLDYHSLFFWYLDDGCLISYINEKNGYGVNNLRIGLKSFKDENILNFINQFESKYDIKFNIEKDKEGKIFRIYLASKKSIVKFLQILYPLYDLIPESLKYKFQPIFTDEKFKSEFSYLVL